jgi:uncharacterized membrane protein
MNHKASSASSNRLEAFSDGVFAILITIMVLGLHAPSGRKFSDLTALRPVFLSYLLSFIYLMIYWNNHHHLLRTVEFPSGWTMWANSNLLFWLSLVPFTTNWLGTSGGAKAPAALYGLSLLMPAISYSVLQWAIIKSHDGDSELKRALGRDTKGKVSPLLYATAIGVAFILPLISYILYAVVAVMWFLPDPRVTRAIKSEH